MGSIILANWKASGATLPAVNVRETNDDFLIEVAAPGMKREDFRLELDNNVLTVSSQTEEKPRTKRQRWKLYTQGIQLSIVPAELLIAGKQS